MGYPSFEELKLASQLVLSSVNNNNRLLKLHAETLETRWLPEILDSLELDGPMTAKAIAARFQHELAPLMIVLKQYMTNGLLVKFYDSEKGVVVYATKGWMLVENSEHRDLLRAVQACERVNRL